MKILNSLCRLFAVFFLDLIVNGLCGQRVFFATTLFYAYSISFYAPLIVRITAAFFVLAQALLYQKLSFVFGVVVLALIPLSAWAQRMLRSERWVRWLVTGALFIFLLLF